MSSNNPESQGQDWPIYPGTPGGQPGSTPPPQSQPSRPEPPNRSSEPPNRSSEPVEERPAQDDAYQAYQSYVHPQPTDHYVHPQPVEGHPRRPSLSRPGSSRPNPSSALQKKYVWIAIGIVAALVITSIARGGFNLWPVIIFAGIAWWVMGNKRKC